MRYKRLGYFICACIYLFFNIQIASASNLTPSSTTIINPRLSVKAAVAGTYKTGDNIITIQTSGQPDNDNTNLFPKDQICFVSASSSSGTCKGNQFYEVKSASNDDDKNKIELETPLVTDLNFGDWLVLFSRTGLAISFTVVNEIPAGGSINIELPAIDNAIETCDGLPDTAETTSVNGFDLDTVGKRITAQDIIVTGCGDFFWNPNETITCGNATDNHKIKIDRTTSSCPTGSVVTVVIDSDPGIINPAPVLTDHVRGQADIYSIDATTTNAAGTRLDTIDTQVAIVEGTRAFVIQADMPEIIQLTVTGVSSDVAHCQTDNSTRVSTTDTEIPFGVISKIDSFYDAEQLLTVSTNSETGYTLSIEQNDQMGRSGKSCPGAEADENSLCVKDTDCDDQLCSYFVNSRSNWEIPRNNGLGYSIASSHSDDVLFSYNQDGGNCQKKEKNMFCALQLPDTEANEQPQVIMRSSNPVDGSASYICYRLSVSNTQPPGLYYNNVTYTAMANF